MDRYVVREPRVGEYPQGNPLNILSTTGNNHSMMIPQEGMYYGGYGSEFPLASPMHRVASSGFMGVTHVSGAQFAPNMVTGQGQLMSGIDPRYLATYVDSNAYYIAGQQQRQIQQQQIDLNATNVSNNPAFANDYQNRSFAGAARNKSTLVSHTSVYGPGVPKTKQNDQPTPPSTTAAPKIVTQENFKQIMPPNRQEIQPKALNVAQPKPKQPAADVVINVVKNEFQNQTATRFDKLGALHRSGPRSFSGPVEKVLKWHKALQDIGVLVLYEIVAKCVSVRPGESCAKNLVVRDDNGPAIQVVYYEIDFLLAELKPPCTVRVIGRMMPGTCRLQAFNVRPATGDDVATLPRRAAVAAHHVAKLCKEYGTNTV